jgi:hypothetical protein
MLEEQLVNNARRHPVVQVIDRAGWLHAWDWEALNIRRERPGAKAQAQLVFWLDAVAIALASRHAPDLWAWRGGITSFCPPPHQPLRRVWNQTLPHHVRSGLRNQRTTAHRRTEPRHEGDSISHLPQ